MKNLNNQKIPFKEVCRLSEEDKKELTRKNLQRVYNELPKLAEKIPEIKTDFNMGIFGIYDKLKKINFKECGTYGCLLGNSARLFVNEFTEYFFDIDNKFCYRFFGSVYFPYMNIYKYEIAYNYLFSYKWAITKFNKFEDAIQRIGNLLDNDLICIDFSFETNKIIK